MYYGCNSVDFISLPGECWVYNSGDASDIIYLDMPGEYLLERFINIYFEDSVLDHFLIDDKCLCYRNKEIFNLSPSVCFMTVDSIALLPIVWIVHVTFQDDSGFHNLYVFLNSSDRKFIGVLSKNMGVEPTPVVARLLLQLSGVFKPYE